MTQLSFGAANWTAQVIGSKGGCLGYGENNRAKTRDEKRRGEKEKEGGWKNYGMQEE